MVRVSKLTLTKSYYSKYVGLLVVCIDTTFHLSWHMFL